MFAIPSPLWDALWLSMQLALVTTIVLLCMALPLVYLLTQVRPRGGLLLDVLIAMPIVLPPTVIGFYVLVAFAPQHALGGAWQQWFGSSLAFSFPGLVIGSVLYSLPFAVQPIKVAALAVDGALIEAAYALGARRRQVYLRVVMPAARHGIIAGALLSFAHTIGEFGVVLMIGGNIPGQTRVASIALYDETQKLDFALAHRYALLLLIVSFVLLLAVTLVQERGKRAR